MTTQTEFRHYRNIHPVRMCHNLLLMKRRDSEDWKFEAKFHGWANNENRRCRDLRQSIAMALLLQREILLSRRRRGKIIEHVHTALLTGNREAIPVGVGILDGVSQMAHTRRVS
jgi:hypothetical protein